MSMAGKSLESIAALLVEIGEMIEEEVQAITWAHSEPGVWGFKVEAIGWIRLWVMC